MNDRILVIIPSFNVAKTIASVIEGVKSELPDADIVVINDGSSDDTAEIALREGADVVSLYHNIGYGAALQTGYLYARLNGYDIVVQMDGDGQHDPSSLKTLLRPIFSGDADVVVGSRFLGETGYKPSFSRRIGMGLFGLTASLVIRQKVTDPTSGFQAMRRPVVELFCTDVFPVDYPDADVLILLHFAKFRIREVPVKMYMPEKGKSMHRGHKNIYYIFKMFLSIAVTLLRQKPAGGRLCPRK
ncbi:MAG: glycosyltransferase family 2 protein [Candidatus Tritonobacter lacicola]|nr:glycosyltransferase family 2 protein [Candidatus Tritonobacter lacicola]